MTRGPLRGASKELRPNPLIKRTCLRPVGYQQRYVAPLASAGTRVHGP